MAVGPTKGVADYDNSLLNRAYRNLTREPQEKATTGGGIQYSKGEVLVLASIVAIRRNFSDKRRQLELLRELECIARSANLRGRDKEAIEDVRMAIDEIEMGYG